MPRLLEQAIGSMASLSEGRQDALAALVLREYESTRLDEESKSEHEVGGAVGDGPEASGPVPARKRLVEMTKDVPDEVFDRIPADSSEQLDHYIYGTTKRPSKGSSAARPAASVEPCFS